VLRELEENGDTEKQTLYRSCQDAGVEFYPLKVNLIALGYSSLLDRVQNRMDVEGNLRVLRRQRFKERGNAVYIPLQAKASLQAPDVSRFPLMETVKDFLVCDQQVFLLLGDSGSGKSTFNRELEYELWQMYKKGGVIPLLINLPAIDRPEHDMIAKRLRKAEFTEPQIRELKLYRKFILICDGYDESQQTHNLYMSNRLNQTGEWQAKMVISCRSEYLGTDYRNRFQPGDRNQISPQALLQEAIMLPFSMDQVRDYIHQYVSVHQPLWGVREYVDILDHIPSLKELVKNPFLMSLSLEVLPRMVDPDRNLSATRITRVALYDQFIEHWFERGKRRIAEKNLSPQERSAFESLSDEGFAQSGIDFLKRLCVAIYKEQGGQPVVRYSRYKDENTWKTTFFSREDERQLLREACPLTRNGNQHRFIHRSLLEYGMALAVFDPNDLKEVDLPEPGLAHREGTSPEMSLDIHGTTENTNVSSRQEPDLNSPLATISFVKEPSVLQFLAERIQQEPEFKQLLHDYIQYSKTDAMWSTAAANAITILVGAGVQFNCADLQGIRIPGADLSYGVFDSAQLEGADLKNVNFRCAWLSQASLNKAQMTGVQFGELPFLQHKHWIESSSFSPDGYSFAVGLARGDMIVYSTSNWEVLWESTDHDETVHSLAYSPSGDLIASGSSDNIVRIWDAKTGGCRHTLTGHKKAVYCIAFSPQGDQVASASDDKTLRLWDVLSGECLHTLQGHDGSVSYVAYAPKENQIASCSSDKTVRLWDINAGICSHTLKGHIYGVNSVVYSPQGDQVASASDDETVRLWDTTSGTCLHILTGHTDNVDFATFSPQGDQVASASRDKTVKLWDVATGACRHTLTGHVKRAMCVTYSPRGGLVASGSFDGVTRLWDIEAGVCRQTLLGHKIGVSSIKFSPGGDRIATCSNDKTVRLWDVKAGMTHPSIGYSGRVLKVMFSPSGDQVASGSGDGTIRLWDVETGVCRYKMTGHIGMINFLAFSPQGDRIASASDDTTVRLWNTQAGECRRILIGHTKATKCVAYSPKGNQIASCSLDRTVRLWDTLTGECSHTLHGHTSDVNSIVYLLQGNQIASASEDYTVRLWDALSGACLHILTGHTGPVWHVDSSPQGDQIASASDDTTVRIWDVTTGECHHTFTGHFDHVVVALYSPRGGLVASGSDDRTIRLWDIDSGKCLHNLTGHTHVIFNIQLSPRGDQVATIGADKTMRLWNVASGQCQTVIQHHMYIVHISWSTNSDLNYLIGGFDDGSVAMWQVMDDGDVRLRWRALNNELFMKNVSIQDTRGLSQINKKLLEQRGAVGEPTHDFREASRKVTTMASAVSKLKSSSNMMVAGSPTINPLVEQSDQVEQAKESRPLGTRRCTM